MGQKNQSIFIKIGPYVFSLRFRAKKNQISKKCKHQLPMVQKSARKPKCLISHRRPLVPKIHDSGSHPAFFIGRISRNFGPVQDKSPISFLQTEPRCRVTSGSLGIFHWSNLTEFWSGSRQIAYFIPPNSSTLPDHIRITWPFSIGRISRSFDPV